MRANGQGTDRNEQKTEEEDQNHRKEASCFKIQDLTPLFLLSLQSNQRPSLNSLIPEFHKFGQQVHLLRTFPFFPWTCAFPIYQSRFKRLQSYQRPLLSPGQ